MKKMILVLSMMLIASSVYAIEYSVGLTAPGFGVGILQGDTAKQYTDFLESGAMGTEVKKVFSPSFAPAVQLDFMVELLPFLAIETGLGWTYSSIIYESEEIGGYMYQANIVRNELTIPIMIRGQYEADKFVGYASVGVKLGIPLSKHYMYGKILKDGKEIDETKKPREDADPTYSDMAMDIAFALGGEYRITGAHYVGLRLGYDLNVISSVNMKEMTDDQAKDFDFYQDNFNVSLSYRYAFNSKWTK